MIVDSEVVGRIAGCLLTEMPLGGEVGKASDDQPGAGLCRRGIHLGDPEIGKIDLRVFPVTAKQHATRLDVAVDHPSCVGVAKSFEDLPDHVQRSARRHLLATVGQIPSQIATGDVLSGQLENLVGRPVVIDRDHVRRIETRQDRGFVVEPFDELGVVSQVAPERSHRSCWCALFAHGGRAPTSLA